MTEQKEKGFFRNLQNLPMSYWLAILICILLLYYYYIHLEISQMDSEGFTNLGLCEYNDLGNLRKKYSMKKNKMERAPNLLYGR